MPLNGNKFEYFHLFFIKIDIINFYVYNVLHFLNLNVGSQCCAFKESMFMIEINCKIVYL